MRSLRSLRSAYSSGACSGEEPKVKLAQPRSRSPRPTTTAPAPSPKSTAVPRSEWSTMRLSASAPQTRTVSARPDSTSAAASSSATRKPAQAALTSCPAQSAPSRPATVGARPGVIWSAAIVEAMTRSTSAGVRPATSRAGAQAWAASWASEPSGARRRRSRIPVRRTIHSSEGSRTPARSAWVTTASGSAAPTPKRPALWVPFAVTVARSNTVGGAVARAFDVPARSVERYGPAAMASDLKLGLNTGYWAGGPPPSAIETVAEAEKLGFDSMWAAEAYGSDVLTPLAWWGSQTERIKIGTAIMQMSARTPAASAMAAMAMDHLSGGRFILGLGVSGPQVVEGWYGQ